jgi:site-specific DNA-methyltransferase (adenine-specific)/modification methylase
VLKHIIRIASSENDVILDPFMGVGSTGEAALEMNRKFIGFEIESKYFEVAKKRLSSIQKSLFVMEEKSEYKKKKGSPSYNSG